MRQRQHAVARRRTGVEAGGVGEDGVGYAGDLLELKGPGRRPVLIPFTEWSVLEIDLEAGRLLVDPVAAGLSDDKDPDSDNPFSTKRK